MKKRITPSHYCELLDKAGIIPNFFVSIPYLEYSDVECFIDKGWTYVMVDGYYLFPPIPIRLLSNKVPSKYKIWSDFENNPKINLKNLEFLDYEYKLDCLHFNELSGGKWATYRKNIRKWAKTNANWSYNSFFNLGKTRKLLGQWMETKLETIQDPEFIIDYITDGGSKDFSGVEIQSLYDWKGTLMGINVWDENYQFINYRFCIVKPGEPFLDEFMRHLFYTDSLIQRRRKLINDGGCLGSKGLEKFKDKLNPISKRKVHSWEIT